MTWRTLDTTLVILCNMMVIRVTSRINSVKMYQATDVMLFLTTIPALLLTSNRSTYCSLIAERHASKRQLITWLQQKRESLLGLNPSPSNPSACIMSFWMTEAFLTSPTIMTMCFIILTAILFCASSSILYRILMRQWTRLLLRTHTWEAQSSDASGCGLVSFGPRPPGKGI